MAETEVWTVGRLLGWTTDYLKGHGSDSPRLDAEVRMMPGSTFYARRGDVFGWFVTAVVGAGLLFEMIIRLKAKSVGNKP